MKIFCPDILELDPEHKNINPIIKFTLQNQNNAANLELVDTFSMADFITPAYTFTQYYNRKSVQQIADWARDANKNKLKVFVWHKGDLNPVKIDNTIYLQTSVDRSKRSDFRVSVPFFNEDPINNLFNGKEELHPYTLKPEVAFCGYANINYIKIAYSILMTAKQKLLFKKDINTYYPPDLIPTVIFRNQVLNRLHNDKRLHTDFIIRRKFNVGKKSLNYNYDNEDKFVREYFTNMVNNQYVVCVRGYGNYSVRFFETMAMGRIPLFIDTDTDLPWADKVDYKEHCAWVPKNQIRHMGDILLEFHQNLNDENIIKLQKSNREFWVDRLSFNGFFSHFIEFLSPYI